ncbi:MAG: serine hydrolase [Candidatus Aminicenantaceae bacterium]
MNVKISLRFLRPVRSIMAVVVFMVVVLIWMSLAGSAENFQTKDEAANPTSVFPGDLWERIADPSSVGYSAEGLEKVREYTKTIDTTSLLIIVGGKVLFEYGDLEKLSYLASCRKSILSILYGKYVFDGTIRLNTTLEDLGITDIGGLLDVEKKATIDHLITARSGIYHPASNSGDNTADAPPRGSQQPGEYFLYNNWDFNLAGYIFEKLTHQIIYDSLEHDLAIPLNMQDFNRLGQKKSGNLTKSLYPAYHIWLSTRDMARIGYLMLRDGIWNGRQVVPTSWVKRIRRVKTPVEEMNPAPYKEGSFGYGYMWWVWDGPKAGPHFKGAYTASGAYGQYITVLPVLDMVIAHKTVVPPYKRRVTMGQYRGIFERLIEAKN